MSGLGWSGFLKREIEESRESFHQRIANERAKHAKREAEVLAAAEAAVPERRKKLLLADRQHHRGWAFSCTVRGGFIVFRWKNDGVDNSHAINLAGVTDIVLNHGTAVGNHCLVRYNDHDWEFSDGYAYADYGWNYSPYWTDVLHRKGGWPSPARDASIVFTGTDFSITGIPHRHAAPAYEAIMSAIEGGDVK